MSKIKLNARSRAEVGDAADLPSSAELKCDLDLAGLIYDLTHAEKAREKLFAKIVRFVRHREANGLANAMMEQIAYDNKLCKLLADYEAKSEIIGMMEFVRDLKMKPPPLRVSRKTAESQR
jgi:hypothetical protein